MVSSRSGGVRGLEEYEYRHLLHRSCFINRGGTLVIQLDARWRWIRLGTVVRAHESPGEVAR